MGDVERKGDNVTKSFNRLKGGGNDVARMFSTLKVGALAVTGALVAGGSVLIRYTDQWNSFQARVRNSTSGLIDFNRTQSELLRLSKANGVQLETTTSLFQGLARVSNELGASSDQMLRLTDTVQKLGVIGGSTTEQMKNGLLQFTQGLASGIFRAEEMNSVLENMPEVAAAIARGMKEINPEFQGGIGALRAMVREGKLLSKEVFDALLTQADSLQQRFENMPMTAGRAMNSLQVELTRVIGGLGQALGASEMFGDSIFSIVEWLEGISAEDFANVREGFDELIIKATAWYETVRAVYDLLTEGREGGLPGLGNLMDSAVGMEGNPVGWESFLGVIANVDTYMRELTGSVVDFGLEMLNVEELIHRGAMFGDELGLPASVVTRFQEASAAIREQRAELEAQQETVKQTAATQEQFVQVFTSYVNAHKDGEITLDALTAAAEAFYEAGGPQAEQLRDLGAMLLQYVGAADAASTETYSLSKEMETLIGGLKNELQVTKQFEEDLKKLNEQREFAARVMGRESAEVREIDAAIDELNLAYQEEIKQIRKRNEARTSSEADDYILQLERELELIKAGAEAYKVKAQHRIADMDATDEQRQQILDLQEQIFDEQESAKRAEAQAKAYYDAWQRALERLDQSFVDLWKSAFNGFDDFKDAFVDSAKSLFAEIAHQNTTGRWIDSLGAAIGIPGSGGSGTGGVGGGSSAIDNTAGLGGTLRSMFGGGSGNAANFLANGFGVGTLGAVLEGGGAYLSNAAVNLFGFGSGASTAVDTVVGGYLGNMSSTGTSLGFSGNTAVGVGALVNAAAGYAGSYVGNFAGEAILGKEAESGWGATAGTLVGSYWGPWGAAIGGAIGGFVDVLFGGDGRKRSNTGTLLGSGAENRGSTEQFASGLYALPYARRGDASVARQFTDTLSDIDALLTGVSRASGATIDFSSVTFGRNADAGHEGPGDFFGAMGFNGAGTLRGEAESFIREWISVARSSLDDDFGGFLDEVVSRFGENGQIMLELIGNAGDVYEAFNGLSEELTAMVDVLDNTEGVWALGGELVAQAGRSMAETWRKLGSDIVTLRAEMDEAADFRLLIDTVKTRYDIELQLIGDVLTALESYNTVFDSTREKIELTRLRQQDPSGTAEYNYYRGGINDLAAQLAAESDPNRIMGLLSQIDAMSNRALGLLTPEEIAGQTGADILSYFDAVEALALQQLEDSREAIRTEQANMSAVLSDVLTTQGEVINAQLTALLEAQTEAQREVANSFSSSTTLFADAVNAWLANGQQGPFPNWQDFAPEVGGSTANSQYPVPWVPATYLNGIF